MGAGLDFIAGSQRRAPVWVQRLALEWAWRMLGDPGRLAGRYAACAAALPGLGLSALRARGRG
ncbi:UDP-N-acetyl-D-mannosaminuronic acid transferase (WecB/TagA/CpsF family) [Rhodovulum iodosum]|uniref:UDP-N-acetyl-D-mannosaminuronic acid transferase (WecB/TagA/CpsF family) n=1 Tax=Rhodovulum iodosum TaxID=68291 RepID=A0ABV3XY30_9RHOB